MTLDLAFLVGDELDVAAEVQVTVAVLARHEIQPNLAEIDRDWQTRRIRLDSPAEKPAALRSHHR